MTKPRSTNPLERLDRRIGRRSDVVRDRVDEGILEALVRSIRSHGLEGRFCEKMLAYYEEAGQVCWTMGAPVAATTIVKRRRREDTHEQRLANGTPERGTRHHLRYREQRMT